MTSSTKTARDKRTQVPCVDENFCDPLPQSERVVANPDNAYSRTELEEAKKKIANMKRHEALKISLVAGVISTLVTVCVGTLLVKVLNNLQVSAVISVLAGITMMYVCLHIAKGHARKEKDRQVDEFLSKLQ